MTLRPAIDIFFFFNDTATTEIYTLSLHDALPILHANSDGLSGRSGRTCCTPRCSSRISLGASRRSGPERSCYRAWSIRRTSRSEEHTSELQSPCNLVCRLLLEKKKKRSQHT